MKNVVIMASLTVIMSATILSGMFIVYNALYKQNQEILARIELIHGMLKREIEFCIVNEQDEIDKMMFGKVLDFKTTGGECLHG